MPLFSRSPRADRALPCPRTAVSCTPNALHRTVVRRSFLRNAPDLAHSAFDFLRRKPDAEFGSSHAADRFLRQRSAEIVRSPAQNQLARLDSHLDPRNLNIRNESAKQNARNGVHPPVFHKRRTRPGLPSKVNGSVLVHKGQKHKLRESTGFFLDTGDSADVENP